MNTPLRTLTVDDLAALLHRTPATIKVDLSRRPDSLPPRLIIPGSRTHLWLLDDVNDWLRKCSTARKK